MRGIDLKESNKGSKKIKKEAKTQRVNQFKNTWEQNPAW